VIFFIQVLRVHFNFPSPPCVLHAPPILPSSTFHRKKICTGYEIQIQFIILRVSISERGGKSFSSPSHPDRLWGPESSIQWVPGAPSQSVKQPWREADHSPQSSVKMRGAVPPFPHTSSRHDT